MECPERRRRCVAGRCRCRGCDGPAGWRPSPPRGRRPGSGTGRTARSRPAIRRRRVRRTGRRYPGRAERPEQLARHHQRAGGRLRVPGGVEGHEPEVAVVGPPHEARGRPGALQAGDHPALLVHAVERVGAAQQLGDRDGPRQYPVGEPARVRHLVDGVDVLRADARGRPAGPREQVVRQVVQQLDVARRNARRVLRLGLAPERVVIVELPAAAGHGRQDDRRYSDDRNERPAASPRIGARRLRFAPNRSSTAKAPGTRKQHHDPQNAGDALRMQPQPSLPFANSTRNGVLEEPWAPGNIMTLRRRATR